MRLLICCLLSASMSTPAMAQRAQQRFEVDRDSAVNAPSWSVLRVAKWTTLLASTGAAVYGFTQNRVADREYEDIERLCQNEPVTCALKPGISEYADPALESRYQSVVDRDDRARLALLAGQIGLAATVLMFILDLPNNTTPEDIPYDPRRIRLGMRDGEVSVGLVIRVR